MGKQNDSLVEVENPDRVHYATGVLLNAEDFQAEQDYHRGRLARALRYANGWGTLAGLEIDFEAEVPASGTTDGKEERIMIEPGIAIDRLGRLIEVLNPLCLRTRVWYQQQAGDELHNSWHAAGLFSGAPDGVAVDVFIRFAACERGKTPAFSSGPFDTIDAVTAARLRDGYETELVLRQETKPRDPESPWTGITGTTQTERTTQMRGEIFKAWQESTKNKNLDGLDPLAEHPTGLDTTSLFLARMIIPADRVGPGQAPTRRPNDPIVINNDLRPFVITANALALILGIKISTSSGT
jgi:hypothetical protein